MYSMWKIMCFLNLEPRKHIALHQIHKIMFFLATSYDPSFFFSVGSDAIFQSCSEIQQHRSDCSLNVSLFSVLD